MQDKLRATEQVKSYIAKFQKDRPTIGLLLSTLDNPIHSIQWLGVVDGIKEYNFNLVCFTGTALLHKKEYDEQANMVYELIDANRFDAFIIWTSNISFLLNDQELAGFLEKFRSVPVICCERAVPGLPCLLQNDYEGMFEAVDHLITKHGHKRIAFMRGPQYHVGAQSRYKAYTDVLAKHKLPLDHKLVADPVLWRDGILSMKQLLDERGLKPGQDFDALVGASWKMLAAGMDLLAAQGCYVPHDLAAVCYDDPIDIKIAQPTLTTVRAPLYELGRKAVSFINDLLSGKEVPSQTYMPTNLIIRESCGCVVPKVISENEMPSSVLQSVAQDKKIEHMIIENLLKQIEFPSGALQWLTPLMDAFFKAIATNDQDEFLKQIKKTLPQVESNEYFISTLNRIIPWLRLNFEHFVTKEQVPFIYQLCEQAQILISSEVERIYLQKQLANEKFNRTLHSMEIAMVNISELEDLVDIIKTYLPQFGIPGCYLSLFEEHRPYKYNEAAPGLSKLLLAYQNNTIVNLTTKNLIFPSCQLIPTTILTIDSPFIFIVESLYFRKDQIGFVIFEMGSRNGFLYNILRSLISNAIQEVLLFETQLKSEKALTNYAAELARTNTELIRSNKELELFAYAASHDLQEPLRMIKSYLQLIQRRYQHKLDKNADEFIWFAMDGANRMEMMIGDLLAYSRITTQVKPFERCDCKEILLEVLTNLQVSIKESEAIVTYDNLPVLVGDRNQLWRVFQNLIANAIKFRSDKPPHVHVGVQKKEKEWEFAVRDNGIGIPQEAYERIFMIFQRLHTHKEYKGMGIGLALCKKIIEHHNGRIWVYSVIGSGSSFFFTLPDRF